MQDGYARLTTTGASNVQPIWARERCTPRKANQHRRPLHHDAIVNLIPPRIASKRAPSSHALRCDSLMASSCSLTCTRQTHTGHTPCQTQCQPLQRFSRTSSDGRLAATARSLHALHTPGHQQSWPLTRKHHKTTALPLRSHRILGPRATQQNAQVQHRRPATCIRHAFASAGAYDRDRPGSRTPSW